MHYVSFVLSSTAFTRSSVSHLAARLFVVTGQSFEDGGNSPVQKV